MTIDRVMLLIDADNVSVDVIEQAVAHLLQAHGALHVRRAYGTAESAVKHQAAFKRLSIKPMVNLSAGKNSTDIALAVDALDLVLAERPDVVAIASSDSDFAPLVSRLREKGCRVVGYGQDGKTGDETIQVYDEYTVLTHRRAGAAAEPKAAPKAARKAPAKRAAKTVAKTAAAPAAKKTPGRRKAAAPAPAAAAGPAAGPGAAAPAGPSAEMPPVAVPPAPPPAPAQPPDKLQRIMASLPELGRGETIELRVASVRLRDAGLLTKSGSCAKLFGAYRESFELLPAGQPNHVRLRATAQA